MSRGPETNYWRNLPFTRKAAVGAIAAGLGAALASGADEGELQRYPFVFLGEESPGFVDYIGRYIQLENNGSIMDDKSNVGGVWTRSLPTQISLGEKFSIGFQPRVRQGSGVRHAITIITAKLNFKYPDVQRPESYRILGIAVGSPTPQELLLPDFSVSEEDIGDAKSFKISADTVGRTKNGVLVRNRAPNGEKLIIVNR